LIPENQWSIYRQAFAAVRATGRPFLLGGGFGLAIYMDHWRNTKDIDFYILPEDRDYFVSALEKAGFADYYKKHPYDRGWIYRSHRQGVIVDVIWSMANRHASTDLSWFDRAKTVSVRDEPLLVLPAEELLWCKLFVLQRDHCDWPDLMNLLYAVGPSLDWGHVIKRIGADFPLLKALVTLFDWVCPERAVQLPARVRRQFQLVRPAGHPVPDTRQRARLLDSRAWFAGFLSKNVPLEV
jgi:hypothetical protein